MQAANEGGKAPGMRGSERGANRERVSRTENAGRK